MLARPARKVVHLENGERGDSLTRVMFHEPSHQRVVVSGRSQRVGTTFDTPNPAPEEILKEMVANQWVLGAFYSCYGLKNSNTPYHCSHGLGATFQNIHLGGALVVTTSWETICMRRPQHFWHSTALNRQLGPSFAFGSDSLVSCSPIWLLRNDVQPRVNE